MCNAHKNKIDTNMKSLQTLTVLLLLTVTMFGQVTTNTEQEKPYIEVTGVAEQEIIPDEIYISITIQERNEGKDKITIEKQETDLKLALKDIDIPLESLSLSNTNANYVYVKFTKKDVMARAEYVLKVTDALTVGKVFEKLDELDLNNAYISKVSHSELTKFKKEVRIMAIKAAKEKADYLLAAIGEETGKPLKVYETDPTSKLNNVNNANIRGARNSELYYSFDSQDKTMAADKIIQFEKIKLKAAIYVKFEIK